MLLTVVREPSKNGCTLGEMLLDGAHECYTLEDVVRDEKIDGETAIPAGKYRVVLTMSQRFGKVLPELLNVPNYQGVRIHSGNVAADTRGCILVGEEKGADRVLRSREAMIELMAALSGVIENGESVWIEVKNGA